MKLTNLQIEGNNYLVLQVERDEQGEALLYHELQERMEKISRNIEKCGSLEALEEMGGAATKKFLVHTKNMLREFLIAYQLEQLPTHREDIEEAAANVNNCDIAALLKYSWEKILSIAEDMRNSLMEHLFTRQDYLAPCLAA